MREVEIPPTRLPVFLRALREALARPSLWLICWFVPLAGAMLLAMPWLSWFRGALAHRFEPGSLLASMDEVFRFDHARELGELRRDGASSGAVLALLAMLFGVFSAGGWLQVFLDRSASGHSLLRFFWGGAKFFWRFVRVWIFTLVCLAFATWLTHGWPWKTVVLEWLFGVRGGNVETLDSELLVARLEWCQSGLYAVLFALILAWGDYTRTRLAQHGTRSALWAGIATWFLLLRNPIRTLRPLALILAVEVLVVVSLGRISWHANADLSAHSGWPNILFLFVVGQAALLWQTISRGARYSASAEVSRRLVAPLPKPDPWARRIGGPGGPQYPIDDSGESYVSI